MLNVSTVNTQTARRNIWANLVLTLLISAFAVMFIPFSYHNPVLWFISISVLTYIFVHFGLVFRSKITKNNASQYTLSIPDHYSNTNRLIPLECVISVEICEYRLFEKNNYYPATVSNDFYYRKTMFGYIGAGLIVCYRLPKTMTGDTIVRGIKFPAPKAKEFADTINANIANI